MKNPLRKRIPKELKQDIGKYIVIFVFMLATIGLVSGFLVADHSMTTAYDNSFEKYNIEDGNFELQDKINDDLAEQLGKLDVTLYNNNYIEKTVLTDRTLRIFKNREEVNKVCVIEGYIPKEPNEIGLDRLYAENNDLKINDHLDIDGNDYTITSIVALSDYSSLFSDNADLMFDATKFGVAVVTQDCFNTLGTDSIHYNYSWKYNVTSLTKKEKKELSDEMKVVLAKNAQITNFIPEEDNMAIHFAGDDMGKDKMLMTVLLYIVIVILAFIFGITISNTIDKEASVIGTLRASGYMKSELVRHYLVLPVIVTLIAAVIGNILGYTVFKTVMANLYYHSYSLTTYKTLWNAYAFVMTTVIPCIIMILINTLILINKLSLKPIKLLRHDLKKKQKKRSIKLPKFRFMSRFRLRIIFQNMPNYCMLFIGILFANVLLLFGLMMTPLLNHYSDEINDNLVCDYQYVLKVPIETTTSDVEKYCVKAMNSNLKHEKIDEEITVYGIVENSKYFDDITLQSDDKGIFVSTGVLEKYQVKVGDEVKLQDPYEDTVYQYRIKGSMDYPSRLAIFMNRGTYCSMVNKDTDYFNGYFSNNSIEDIPHGMIASIITQDDMNKVVRQMNDSVGGMFPMISAFSVVLYMLIIYLLSKIVVEMNASAISMVKILGYNDGEISKLYIMSTSMVVVMAVLVSLPISYAIIRGLYRTIFSSFNGWITFYIDPMVLIKMITLGLVTYAVIAFLQFRKIKNIPKEVALKNVE